MFKNNRTHITLPILCAALLIAGCSSDNKKPLEGERVSVLQFQDGLTVDEASQSIAIQVDEAKMNTAWPQPGGNAIHAPGNVMLPNKLKHSWSTSIGDGSSKHRKLITAPIASPNRVYAANTEGDIVALDLTNGKEVWSVNVWGEEADSATVSPGLSFSQNVLYVADGINSVLALNAETGETLWRQTLENPVRGAPTVQDGRVYIVTLADVTVALNVDDGSVLWRHKGVQEAAGLLGAPSPAAQGSAVITAYSSGDVVALRAETGQEAWSDNLTGVIEFQSRAVTQLSGFRGHPVMDDDTVIIGNSSTRTIAIHLSSGERLWQKEFGLMATPWPSGNAVFALTAQNELVALLKETGMVRWSLSLPRYRKPKTKEDIIFWNGPVLGDQTLWLASNDEKLWGVDVTTGQVVRKIELPSPAMLPPIIVNNTLVVLLDNGTIVAYK